MKKESTINLILFLVVVFYITTLVYTSWISDDAYITFRTVDNFLNGYGLRWNILERVQSYTHPLWMFVIAGTTFFIKNIYVSTTLLGFVFSLFTVYLIVTKVSISKSNGILAILTMGFSKAYIDYSTSGLENPLSYFLFILFLIAYYKNIKLDKKNIFKLSFIASLIMLNRLDLSLILFPIFLSFLLEFLKGRKLFSSIKYIFLGFVPLILWELFSIIYYGFPFPNTAYAKLGSFIPANTLMLQGLHYFKNSLVWDPLTLIVIFLAIISSLIVRNHKSKLLSFGIVLYLFYIVKIGGDFMTGRFFSVPLLCAIVIMLKIEFDKRYVKRFGIVIFLLGSYQLFHTNFINIGHIHDFDNGIADERLYYYENAGLIPCSKRDFQPNHKRGELGKEVKKYGLKVVQKDAVGMFGYFAGPGVHVIDQYGLCDPLLARIPKMEYYFRIGHLRHLPPPGYQQSLVNEKNLLFDSSLKQYYSKLLTIVKAPLFSKVRFKTILQFNLNRFNDLIKGYENNPTVVPYNFINKPIVFLDNWNSKDVAHFTSKGLQIEFNKNVNAKRIKLSIDEFNSYKILFFKDEKKLLEMNLPDGGFVEGDIVNIELLVPQIGNFNRILIKPTTKVGANSLGFFGLFDGFGQLIEDNEVKNNVVYQSQLTNIMKNRVFKVIGNEEFVRVNSTGGVLISKKESDFSTKELNDFKKTIETGSVHYIVVEKGRIPYLYLEKILKLSAQDGLSMIEDNIAFSLFAIEKKEIKELQNEKEIFNWSIGSDEKITTYYNKNQIGRNILFYDFNSVTTSVTKENSSFIVYFANDKVWKDNAGYIDVENGTVSIVLTAKALNSPFDLYPFVVFYDKFGKKVEAINGVKLHLSTEGLYRLHFRLGKNSIVTPYLKVPDNGISMGVGFNFYKDKGTLNVKQLKVFQN